MRLLLTRALNYVHVWFVKWITCNFIILLIGPEGNLQSHCGNRIGDKSQREEIFYVQCLDIEKVLGFLAPQNLHLFCWSKDLGRNHGTFLNLCFFISKVDSRGYWRLFSKAVLFKYLAYNQGSISHHCHWWQKQQRYPPCLPHQVVVKMNTVMLSLLIIIIIPKMLNIRNKASHSATMFYNISPK